MSKIDFYLIRHGESERNTHPNLVGQSPCERLTSKGEDQAKLLGAYFLKTNMEFDSIYVSPYKRALDTAHLACDVFTKVDPHIVNDLREYSAGDMLNHDRAEVQKKYSPQMAMLGMNFKFTNGESLYDVEERVSNWLVEHILLPDDGKDKKIAIFSHGMTIKCLLHYVMQFDHKLTWKVSLDNTSVSRVSLIDGVWFIKAINDTRHLG